MKKQILTLIIGILIGAIITTAVFLIIKGNTGGQGNKMDRGEMPSMDESSQNGENGFSRPGRDSNSQTENTDASSSNIEE